MGAHFYGTAARRSAARDKIVRAALAALARQGRMTYTQTPARWDGIRRALRRYKGQTPRSADCSALSTWCYWDGLKVEINRGLGDILNGQRWTGGYTGTLLQTAHGKTIARGLTAARRVALLRADLVLYGVPGTTGKHVALVVDPAKRLAVSFGSQGGPYLVRIDYRTDIIAVKRYIY
jgi:hypothetical protein